MEQAYSNHSPDYTDFNDSAFVVINGQVTVLASIENGVLKSIVTATLVGNLSTIPRRPMARILLGSEL